MQNAFGPLVSMYQSQLEASRRFADALFAGTEKIDRVMIGATHRAFTEQLRFAQQLASANDPGAAGSALQSGFFSRQPERAMNYQTELIRVVSEVQSDIGQSMKDYVEEVSMKAAGGASAPLQNMQEQAADNIFNPVTSMFSVWESAFKEVAALAQKNMMSATKAGAAMQEAGVSAASNAVSSTVSTAANALSGSGAGNERDSGGVIITEESSLEDRKSPSPGAGKRK